MKKVKLLLFFFASVGLVITGFFLLKSTPWKGAHRAIPSKSFTITKAWWPVWDTFQIGVRQRENVKKSFQTTFIQNEDYGTSLNDFLKGNADAATLTIYEALLAASKGISLKIVLLLDYTIGSDGVVAKKSIQSLQDLKGKRIGVEQGTIAHFTVLKMLEKAGLDQADVQLVDLGLEELQQAFLHVKVDAVGTYEPYMSNLARQGNGHIIFSSIEIPRAICDVLFIKNAIARDHPDVIDHWIEAWNDILNYTGNDPEEYLRTLNRLNGTPIPEIKESFSGIFFATMAENRRAFGTPDNQGYLLESLREMEDFLLRQGIIKQHIALEELIEIDGIRRFFRE